MSQCQSQELASLSSTIKSGNRHIASGTWEMSIKTPVGMRYPILLINDDGTGILNEKEIIVRQEEDVIQYRSSRYSWMGTMIMENEATISGDHMEGKSVIVEGPMKGSKTTWKAFRLPE